MIDKLTDYIEDSLSGFTLGVNLFSGEFRSSVGTAACLYEGRFSTTGTDPAALNRVEVIVEGRAMTPAAGRAIVDDICALLVNRANIVVAGLSNNVTITGGKARQMADRDENKRLRFAATLVVTYK